MSVYLSYQLIHLRLKLLIDLQMSFYCMFHVQCVYPLEYLILTLITFKLPPSLILIDSINDHELSRMLSYLQTLIQTLSASLGCQLPTKTLGL